MIIINNKVINASIISILTELQSQLRYSGINKLRTIKIVGNNAQIPCPIHSQGNEKKPSAGVVLNSNEKTEAGTCHCFTCGYVADLSQFVSNCFGYNDGGKFGTHWLLENFSNDDVRQRKSLNLKIRQKTNITNNYISDEELDKYRYYHDYMYKRKLTDEIIQLFDVGYDKNTDCLTFPVNDENGNCVFIARRSIKGKYFNYPAASLKPVYALDKIPKDTKSVVVCESIINALTCWVYGDYAIALLGTGTQEQYEILKRSHIRKFVLGFDGDSAGDKACIRFKKALANKAIITKLSIPRNKDINDLSKEEYLSLKESYF